MSNDIYRYYVYAYLRSNGTPYYIGKGCGGRVYSKHRRIPVPKDKNRIIFLETNLSNIGACALERRYIRWYGRKDMDTGILRNMTDGGDGGDNFSQETKAAMSDSKKGKKLSQETKAAMSDSKRGKKLPQEHRAAIAAAKNGENHHMYGKKHTQETKDRMSISRKNYFQKLSPENRKGKPLSSEHKAAISNSLKGKSKSSEHIIAMSVSRKGKKHSKKHSCQIITMID